MKAKEQFFQRLIDTFASQHDGFTTAQCAALFTLKRNVISHYLNRLHDDGLLEKEHCRPVRFRFTESLVSHQFTDCFSTLTGSLGSLQKQIALCRAAIDYPPDGLALLLTGESGTGKSHLASLIHYYAQQRGYIPADRPQVQLNCADYANNPELLSSILFGYSKGAFTGADRQKTGLLDQADQGTLFLDEVHRLSAENQEKLFLFMDKGYFYPLGDNKHPHSARIRFIFATTENTNAVLLNTFRRRIPVTVSLPAYHKWTYFERATLIELFLHQEAQLLQRDIYIEKTLYLQWLNQKFIGNIGELKNKIKVLCATSWSHQKNKKILYLNDNITAEVLSEENTEKYTIVHHNMPFPVNHSQLTMDDKIWQAIKTFCSTGNARQYLNTLTTQIITQQHISNIDSFFQGILWQTIQSTLKRFSKLWGVTLAEHIYKSCYVSYYIALHCPQNNTHHQLLNQIRHQHTTKAFLMAYELINALPMNQELKAPDLMLALSCLLLSAVTDKEECIQGVIVTHGESTATSIAALANQLTGGYYFKAFNMPYPVSTHTITNELIQHLNLLHSHAGMIILVDMGSLKEIYQEIHRHLRGDLVVINNVTTLLALDIAEKIQQHFSINDIISQIPGNYETEVRYYSGDSNKKQIIVSCISGEGIAKKLQDILCNVFSHADVDIITLDYTVLKKQIQQKNALLNTCFIITTTEMDAGDIPCFSIREIIDGQNNTQLQHYFKEWLTETEFSDMVRDLLTLFTIKGISRRLAFLNPDIVINEVETLIDQYQQYYHCHFENYLHISLVMHIALMIERLMLNKGHTHWDNEVLNEQQKAFIHQHAIIFQPFIDKYQISLPVTETLMIYEILANIIETDTSA